MTAIDNLSILAKELPEKDIELALKFILGRDFISLKEILNADIHIIRKNELKKNPDPQYLNINLDKLYEMRMVLEEYMSYLDYDYNSYD